MKYFYNVFVCLITISYSSFCWAVSVQDQVLNFADTTAENGVLQGKDGWLFLQEELEHLGHKKFFGSEMAQTSKAVKPEFADPLPAIVDFSNQLKKFNIELLFVPIPPKALIYSDKLPAELPPTAQIELQKPYEEFYKKLQDEGVQILDLIPLYSKERQQNQVYCKTDTHFSGSGIETLVHKLGKLIKTKKWYPAVPQREFVKEQKTVSIVGDLTQMQKKDGQEALSLDFVVDTTTGKHCLPEKNSPVLLLGDSHTLVFSVGGDLHATGAGLFDNLSAELGFPVDRIGVRGSGATPSRIKLYQRSRKDPAMIAGKKIVIWCLSARELTGSGGWRKIPVAKKE